MKVSRLILLSAICIVAAGLTPRLVTQTLAGTEKKEHVVVKGDTLWDISTDYLYDPFQWPRLWNVNRDIENPQHPHGDRGSANTAVHRKTGAAARTRART